MEKIHGIGKNSISSSFQAEQFQKNILLKLKGLFDEQGRACVFNESDSNSDVHSISVLYSDFGEDSCEVLGEFCFLPMRKKEEYYTFNIIFSITEDINMEYYEELSHVVEKINFSLPIGAFILDDRECILAYKHVCIIPFGVSSDEVVSYITNILGAVRRMVEKNVCILTRVERGEISYEQFVESL